MTAHELTHAVTEHESNLIYSGESGGLNEAMSRHLRRACARAGRAARPVRPRDIWMVGEDIWTPGTAGDALRYMDDPAKDGASLDYYAGLQLRPGRALQLGHLQPGVLRCCPRAARTRAARPPST